jgi:hypothetical protein
MTAMRLTLRTLLAYLDDTLDPAEIRQIGLKVAESDAAQELIARIKQVTRRRRLTTPPATGPGAKFDPNTIAEYLDNLLPPEQVADVEKTCLESDVHLAEISACHQILTLVLGQPALVPPTARQRMIALVEGKEAIPSRGPARADRRAQGLVSDGVDDEDDAAFLGLPLSRETSWLRWALPVAAAVLFVALGVLVWMALTNAPARNVAQLSGDPKTKPSQASNTSNTEKTNPDKPTNDQTASGKPADKGPPPDNPNKGDTANANKGGPADNPNDTGSKIVVGVPNQVPDQSPSKDNVKIGKYALAGGATPSLLIQGSPANNNWLCLKPEDPVSTGEMLLTLPGYHALLHTDSGMELYLMGNLPQFLPRPFRESAVVLHAASKPFDLDFTLDRGRVFLANQKDKPASARVRFQQEIWDVNLEEGAEVGLELLGTHTVNSSFGTNLPPTAMAFLMVSKGQVSVKIGANTYPLRMPPGPALIQWSSDGRLVPQPLPIEKASPVSGKTFPASEPATKMKLAVDELWNALTRENKPVEVILLEAKKKADPNNQMLAVWCLGAIDALPQLVDDLDDDKHPEIRQTARDALRHWIGRNPGQDDKLFDSTHQTGVLIDKKYKPGEANLVMLLLHYLGEFERKEPETWDLLLQCLRHKRLAIRDLAYSHLVVLVPQGRSIPYDPVGTSDQIENAYKLWKQLIPDGKLPPSQPSTGQPMPR